MLPASVPPDNRPIERIGDTSSFSCCLGRSRDNLPDRVIELVSQLPTPSGRGVVPWLNRGNARVVAILPRGSATFLRAGRRRRRDARAGRGEAWSRWQIS